MQKRSFELHRCGRTPAMARALLRIPGAPLAVRAWRAHRSREHGRIGEAHHAHLVRLIGLLPATFPVVAEAAAVIEASRALIALDDPQVSGPAAERVLHEMPSHTRPARLASDVEAV